MTATPTDPGAQHPSLSDRERIELRLRKAQQHLSTAFANMTRNLDACGFPEGSDPTDRAIAVQHSTHARAIACGLVGLVGALSELLQGAADGDFGSLE